VEVTLFRRDGAVVGREDDQRVVEVAAVLERLHDPCDLGVGGVGGVLHVRHRVVARRRALGVVDTTPHVRGLVDAREADEDAAPAVALLLHDLEDRVGGPDVAAPVRRVVPDDVAVVGGRVELRRVLDGVVRRVAGHHPARAAVG
jgi:hypothetical protein